LDYRPRSGAPDRALDVPELLALLDWEIDHAYRRSHWPGWTPWALLTALGALLWGFAGRIENVTSPPMVFRSAAATLMVVEVLRRGRRLLERSRELDDESRVLVSSETFGEERPALALELLYSGALLWGIGRYAEGVTPWVSAAVGFWASIMGLLAVTGLLYSLWPVPFPVGGTRLSPMRILMRGLSVMLPALCTIAWVGFIDIRSVENVRVGVLLGAALLVLLEVAREPGEPPLMPELVDVRRGVSLGSIGVVEGLDRTTVILRGLKLEDYVQQDARRMLRAVESLQSAIEDFRPVVDDIRRHVTLFERKQAPDERDWFHLVADWEQKAAAADTLFEHAERWQRRYASRLHSAAAIAKLWHLPYAGQAVVEEIQRQVEGATTQYKSLAEEYRRVLAQLEQALRSAGVLK